MEQPVRKIDEMLDEIQDNITKCNGIEEMDPHVEMQMVDTIAEELAVLGYAADEIVRFKKEMGETNVRQREL